MTVVLTANASADNTFNCYEPPTAPRLLTIATLSNIAFMGHCCVSVLIYVPLGLTILQFVLLGGASMEGADTIIIVIVVFSLIAVSRVATTCTTCTGVWARSTYRTVC